MEYTDFIAVIDLGTSHIVGMVGTKNQDDVLSIIAYDSEKSEDVYIMVKRQLIR